jgi:hypothetical protein
MATTARTPARPQGRPAPAQPARAAAPTARPAAAPAQPQQPSKAVATLPPKELMEQMAAESGGGFEEATRDSYALPFLVILQDLSPQTKKSRAEYIEGAAPGKILNTVSQRLYDKVRVIPCHFSPTVIEWVPRDKGGGFVAAHPANTPLLQDAVRDGASNMLPNGHELQVTAQHFCLLLTPDADPDGVLIAMKSTQLKYSRRWMSQMRAAVLEVNGRIIQPPMWAWSYEITSTEESNDQGTWYSWTIGDRKPVTDASLYNAAKAFAQVMKAGGRQVNYDEMQRQPGGPAGDGGPADLDNEVPM